MKLALAQRTIQSKPFQDWRTATRKTVADLKDAAPEDAVLQLMLTEVAAMRAEYPRPVKGTVAQ
ncbi:MAG: hypothetical protein NTV22_05710 [bacterium]|nr:hypothetical protein [bacterium]